MLNGICPLCHLSNSCADDHNSNSFDCPPDSYNPQHPTYETYSGDFCGNDSQSGYDCPPQFPLNYEPEPGYTQNYNSDPHDSPSFPQQYPCCEDCGNILFDAEYEFESVDDQSLHNEDFQEKIFLNPLFEEEINSIRIDQHHFNAESDLMESMLNRDSSIISSSSKIDSLLDEFAGELTLLKSISPGVDKTDCHPKNKIRL
nr:hypothetical protein [Tanacetum cinerariifolium]